MPKDMSLNAGMGIDEHPRPAQPDLRIVCPDRVGVFGFGGAGAMEIKDSDDDC